MEAMGTSVGIMEENGSYRDYRVIWGLYWG